MLSKMTFEKMQRVKSVQVMPHWLPACLAELLNTVVGDIYPSWLLPNYDSTRYSSVSYTFSSNLDSSRMMFIL